MQVKISNMSLEFSNTSEKGATVQKWSQIKANLVHSSVYTDKRKGANNRLLIFSAYQFVFFFLYTDYTLSL